MLCTLIALAGSVAPFVLTVLPEFLPEATATHTTWTLSAETERKSPTPTTSLALLQSQALHSAVITIAPLTANPMMRRQRCFNDQGFSVDCATWTGYYCGSPVCFTDTTFAMSISLTITSTDTWGPAGNPYEGGPGEGQDGSGSGSGSGGSSGVLYQSGSTSLAAALPALIGLCFLSVVVVL